MATVVVAFHVPLLLGASVSIAGAVSGFDGPVEPRPGMATDERMPALRESESGGGAIGDGQSHLNTFDRDADAGISFHIQGVPFIVDGTVARSYRTELANDAVPEGQDQSVIGDGNFTLTEYNVKRAGANFYEHMKSVSESRFSQRQLLQVDEWNARDFRPPAWVNEVRDMVRSELPAAQAPTATSQSGAADTQSWITEGMKTVMYIQTQFRRMDPVFLAILGVVSVPFALIGIARATRRGRRPSRAGRKRHKVDIAPVKVKPVRRRRKRFRLARVTTEHRH
jgi:hypothetical protein